MTPVEKNKIIEVIKYCNKNNPQAAAPIINSILSVKISDILDGRKVNIAAELGE